MSKRTKNILKTIIIMILVPVVAFCLLVAFLWITEYRPEAVEQLEINGSSTEGVKPGQSLDIMSWNIGYASLGEEEDYFLDGGKSVNAKSKEEVETNLAAIENEILEDDPDILLLQETDRDSKRSFYVDEFSSIQNLLTDYDSTYARNYKVLYIPYPGPTMGRVDCGISTFSKYDISEAERHSLPCPFKFPFRLCNLKRCLSVNRIPVEGTDKELVIINVHLEAYDSGEGKRAQTKQLNALLKAELEVGNYVIAGGDFNQTFSIVDTYEFPQINDVVWVPGQIDVTDFDKGYDFIMDEETASCRSLDKPYKGADKESFQYYVIDGFIVSRNIEINSYGVKQLDYVNSDHNPLLMNITLKE